MPTLQITIPGFTYSDLYHPSKLAELHSVFLSELSKRDSALHARWVTYASSGGVGYTPIEISQILVDLAPHVGSFVAKLFGIEKSRQAGLDLAAREKIIFKFKLEILQRNALKKYPNIEKCIEVAPLNELKEYYLKTLKTNFADNFISYDDELATALMAETLIEYQKTGSAELASLGDRPVEKFLAFCAARHLDEKLHADVKHWASYKLPKTLDYSHLVEIIHPDELLKEKIVGPEDEYRRRDGFALTDERMNPREVRGETEYCIFCHDRSKDSCSKGLHEKDGAVKKNPLGIKLSGCPLDEKISEMHLVLSEGDAISALALIMLDNPMCPGTGHRICNDCMKGCIYQKQTPVNIPQAETGALTDVLRMPWGVEIYGFLTRWNPLNIRRPYVLPYNGKKVLVVGLGPAGYTLSHYLLNEGFGVAGIDGLKIEPLSEELTGAVRGSEWIAPKPIEHWSDIYSKLNERTMDGFGGVAEYGITVRWDKNFLTLIYLTLARRNNFAIYGGVRFGGTMTIEDAFDGYGFDHIAIASGAGKPTIVPMKNNLIRGIRKASDFLMALQLTGAAKKSTMANLQVQLPAVVIGGGLTAIDTATELAAYYPVQVEKVLERHELLVKEYGEDHFMSRLNPEEKRIHDIFLDHGRQIRAERERALAAGEKPNFVPLVRKWGGVTLVYRRSLTESPAYRLNHEEIEKSLEEGIYYVENMSPTEALADELGAVRALIFERQKEIDGKMRGSGEFVEFPAKSVCVAAGTSPNTIYEREFPGTFKKDKWNNFFQPFHLNGEFKETEEGFFTSYSKDGKYITFYGDNHPRYAGNVVKAMASARDGYPHVIYSVFKDSKVRPVSPIEHWYEFKSKLDEDLKARVVRVDRLTKTIVEVIVKAPAAARHFHPGQFYRLQNYEKLAPQILGTTLSMEGLALTGAWVDKAKGLLSLIVLEMGSSSRLCAALKPGEPVVVMGPTGTPTEIPENETVLLAGGGLGNAVLFSIAKALKENNNRVIYFAGYKDGSDLFKREEIEASTDQLIWSTDTGAEVKPSRKQDAHFRGNIIQAMLAYHNGELGVKRTYPFGTVDRIIAIGSDRMMAAVKAARRKDGVLGAIMKEGHAAIGSINSTMQCMMKEVCAQCLQKHVDPVTQEETGFVFSCFNQDQALDVVDFKNLNERLKMNSLEEKLSLAYFEHLLKVQPVQMI
ncbi:MAG: FAD-dependent oxidoreductase [Bacteroidota bacterium]|nr:FAD-dependent oxidoreductase [Bacteroidota bacterium]MDP4230329.1 FAD-dependent oxidoreductase [Bacteroidota bacterium]MDP4235228.1 FAD-dependent oxidoreductase [Bacteroidota bacterium]